MRIYLGCAAESEDFPELVYFTGPWEKHFAEYQFPKDAASRPHVDRRTVCPSREENFWRLIRPGSHIVGVKSFRCSELFGKTEIDHFDFTLL